MGNSQAKIKLGAGCVFSLLHMLFLVIVPYQHMSVKQHPNVFTGEEMW